MALQWCNISDTDTKSAYFADPDDKNVVLPGNLVGDEHICYTL